MPISATVVLYNCGTDTDWVGGGGADMAGKLIRLRPVNFALTGEPAPNADTPTNLPNSAHSPSSGPAGSGDGPAADVVRLGGYGPPARGAESEPSPVPALPIRSAERRRWSAE